MDKITLKNGTELPVIRVIGGSQNIQNANRDTLTLYFDGVGGLDALLAKLADTNQIAIVTTKSVTETDPDTNVSTTHDVTQTNLYTDYTIMFKRVIEQEIVTAETPTTPAVYEDVYVVGVAQKTYLEKMVAQLLGA